MTQVFTHTHTHTHIPVQCTSTSEWVNVVAIVLYFYKTFTYSSTTWHGIFSNYSGTFSYHYNYYYKWGEKTEREREKEREVDDLVQLLSDKSVIFKRVINSVSESQHTTHAHSQHWHHATTDTLTHTHTTSWLDTHTVNIHSLSLTTLSQPCVSVVEWWVTDCEYWQCVSRLKLTLTSERLQHSRALTWCRPCSPPACTSLGGVVLTPSRTALVPPCAATSSAGSAGCLQGNDTSTINTHSAACMFHKVSHTHTHTQLRLLLDWPVKVIYTLSWPPLD